MVETKYKVSILFTDKKDLVQQFLYPVLPLDFKMKVLAMSNKNNRQSVT